MADISVTASAVAKGANAQITTGVAGASITAGMALYIDTANGNVLKPSDVNLSLLASTIAGIALHASLTGQPIAYLVGGPLTFNAVLTAGKVYIASATDGAGGIALVADLTTGWYTSVLGYALSTTVLQVGIINTGVLN